MYRRVFHMINKQEAYYVYNTMQDTLKLSYALVGFITVTNKIKS